jgi:hypothetical protein
MLIASGAAGVPRETKPAKQIFRIDGLLGWLRVRDPRGSRSVFS